MKNRKANQGQPLDFHLTSGVLPQHLEVVFGLGSKASPVLGHLDSLTNQRADFASSVVKTLAMEPVALSSPTPRNVAFENTVPSSISDMVVDTGIALCRWNRELFPGRLAFTPPSLRCEKEPAPGSQGLA